MAASFAICVPTLNPGEMWRIWLESLAVQSAKCPRVCVLDSESDDDTVDIALEYGCEVHKIARKTFNHGATRQLGVELLSNVDVIVFLTQDAILAQSSSLQTILDQFEDKNVSLVYGRQLPRLEANWIEVHARAFNYPDKSQKKSSSDIPVMGLKTAFVSNSFAAYRRSALMSVGGFPNNTILGEDTYVAARMILAGGTVEYCAEATVYHSHGYSVIEEFQRYFDTGVFHSRENWIREAFGGAGGEGRKYVQSEIKYLMKKNKWLIPEALFRDAIKLLGFKFGLLESRLPNRMNKKLSMHKSYWL